MQQEMLLIVLLISLWKVCHLKLNFYSEAYSTVTCRQFVCIMVEMMRCPSHYSYQRGMIVSQLDGITCTIKLVKIINKNRSSDLVPSDWIFLHFVNTFYLINLLDISLLILRQMRQVRVPCRPCLSSVRPRNFQNPILFYDTTKCKKFNESDLLYVRKSTNRCNFSVLLQGPLASRFLIQRMALQLSLILSCS